MACFLPVPLFLSFRSPERRFLHPHSRSRLGEVIRRHDTLNTGGASSVAPIPSIHCCGGNPSMSSTRPRQTLVWTWKGGNVSGGWPPGSEERSILACGAPVPLGEKNNSLCNSAAGKVLFVPSSFVGESDEHVSTFRKTSVPPAKPVPTIPHSIEEVRTLQSIQVCGSCDLASELEGVEIDNENHHGIVKTHHRRIHGIASLVWDMDQLSGYLLPVTGCNGKEEAPTIGHLTDERFLFQELLPKSRDQSLTIWNFNEVLLTLVSHGKLESAMSLFSELPSYGLSPNCWSFSIMIQCLCRKNDPDRGKEVFYDMVKNDFRPTTVLFTILIHSFCKKGKLLSAYELFERMDSMGCHPTIQTYNCLMSGLCYVGRIEEAFRLLKKIENTSINPDIYTFTTIIDGFCKVGRTNDAIELLNNALELGIKPNVVTFNSLINGFCREGRIFEGCGLLREMKGGDCQPDRISYSTLLQGSLKCGEVSEALKIYKEMKETGFEVEERVMNTLLRGICRKCVTKPELLTEAEWLLLTINDIGYCLSPYTYCLIVQALAHGGHIDKALTHLYEMERIGFSARIMTYNMVIRVLCREQRVNDALFVFILMIRGNKIPSVFSCNRLLNELNKRSRFLDACSVFAVALKHGVDLCQQPRKQCK